MGFAPFKNLSIFAYRGPAILEPATPGRHSSPRSALAGRALCPLPESQGYVPRSGGWQSTN